VSFAADPTDVPVVMRGGSWLLDDDGSRSPVTNPF